MLRSMTAFGRAILVSQIAHYEVEVWSINKKFYELNLHLPSELFFLESDIKGWVAGVVERGSLVLKVSVRFNGQAPVTIRPNIPLLRQFKQAYQTIAQELGVSLDSLASHLLATEESLLIHDQRTELFDELRSDLKNVIPQALSQLIAAKKIEGSHLEADILGRIAVLQQLIEEINKRSADGVNKLQQKLREKLQATVPNCVDNDDRLLREIVLYAEKADVTEEIVRFCAHLSQFREIVASDQNSKGKVLDFIIQELGREINTIGSKLPDVTRYVVEAKSELDRVREQLQNVE